MERLYSGKLESNKFVVNILTLFLFLVVISACRIQNPEPITTKMPVQISIPTITPIPSLQTKSQRAKAFNDLWNISCSESNVSPDGKWCAIDMGEDIEVFGIDGITKYQFDLTQTSKPIEICGVFFAEFWSPDHTFLYFAPGICSHTFHYIDGRSPALYRLNLLTGVFSEVLPITGNPISTANLIERGFYDYAFSSDGLYLAYVQTYQTPILVTVKDLYTNREQSFRIENNYVQAGCLTWGLNTHLVIFTGATDTNPGNGTSSSLYVIDMDEMNIQTVFSDKDHLYCPEDSPESGVIRVREIDMQNFSKDAICLAPNPNCVTFWNFNLLKNEWLPQPTVTPN